MYVCIIPRTTVCKLTEIYDTAATWYIWTGNTDIWAMTGGPGLLGRRGST